MKQKKMRVTIGVILGMVLMTLVVAKCVLPIFFDDSTKRIYYNDAVELVQADVVYELVIYKTSADIRLDKDDPNIYNFDIPDQKLFLEFIQEEIQNGNQLVIINGNDFSFWSKELLAVSIIVCYICLIFCVIVYLNDKLDDYEEISLEEDKKKIMAYHKAGHVVAVKSLGIKCNLNEVSILSDEDHFVFIDYKNKENKNIITKTEFKNQLIVNLAGRAAEKVAFEECSTLCFDDLTIATDIAKEMVILYEMIDEMVPISFWDSDYEKIELCDNTKIFDNVINEVQKLLQEANIEAVSIITYKKEFLDKIAQELFENGTISEESLKEEV